MISDLPDFRVGVECDIIEYAEILLNFRTSFVETVEHKMKGSSGLGLLPLNTEIHTVDAEDAKNISALRSCNCFWSDLLHRYLITKMTSFLRFVCDNS